MKNLDNKFQLLLTGLTAFLALYLVVGYASGFIVAVLGFGYPAYAS